MYTYTVPGYYSVTLTATSIAGCSDSTRIDSIVVVPGPLGSFTFNPDSGCTPLTVAFTGTASYIGINTDSLIYTWDFGDGSVVVAQQLDTITHTYYHEGTYNPVLIIGYNLPGSSSQCHDSTSSAGFLTVVTAVTVDIDS